jgi:hypothetical protein
VPAQVTSFVAEFDLLFAVRSCLLGVDLRGVSLLPRQPRYLSLLIPLERHFEFYGKNPSQRPARNELRLRVVFSNFRVADYPGVDDGLVNPPGISPHRTHEIVDSARLMGSQIEPLPNTQLRKLPR